MKLDKELVNHYLDIAKYMLLNIKFDKTHQDKINMSLFILAIKEGLENMAVEVSNLIELDRKKFSTNNLFYKWKTLQEIESIKTLVEQEFKKDGIFYLINEINDLLFKPLDTSIILTNNKLSLKNFNKLLDKCNKFVKLLRNLQHEC